MRDKARGTEAARQASRFKKVRDAHQTEIAEDYVELIAELIETSGEARLVDLAERLGVTNPTVGVRTPASVMPVAFVRDTAAPLPPGDLLLRSRSAST